jgi:hypothetical protein
VRYTLKIEGQACTVVRNQKIRNRKSENQISLLGFVD